MSPCASPSVAGSIPARCWARARSLRRRRRSLRAVHIDHQLQAPPPAWAAHCRRIARSPRRAAYGAQGEAWRAARGTSLEAAAREARYAALAAAAAPGRGAAHRPPRGRPAGDRAAAAAARGRRRGPLRPCRPIAPFAAGHLARPLLEVTHRAAGAWLATQPITFVEDPSNAQIHLDRNYLRAQVLPLIRARWPSASATVARSARHAAQAQRLLDALAAADLAQGGGRGGAVRAGAAHAPPGPPGQRAALLDRQRRVPRAPDAAPGADRRCAAGCAPGFAPAGELGGAWACAARRSCCGCARCLLEPVHRPRARRAAANRPPPR